MRISLNHFSVWASTALALGCAACQVAGPVTTRARVLHEWYDDGGPGKVAVCISLADQIAEIERGRRVIGWCYVATGKEGHRTPPGNYQITEKIVDKYSTEFGWIEDGTGNVVNGDATPHDRVPKGMVYMPAPMPCWMRLTGYGIGMHGGLIPVPGQPASHGCIRMPKEFAPILFEAVTIGTPVTIISGKSHHDPAVESPSEPPWQGDRRVISSRPLNSLDDLDPRGAAN